MNGYFDANATTPLHPAAREAWLSAPWHNPSGLYTRAAAAREHLENCRERLAELLTCEPGDLVFVSGATEANNAVLAHASRLPAAVSALEHPSVREPAAAAALIPATPEGTVCLDALRDWLAGTPRPGLVSLMAANNETGVLQPWPEALDLCRAAGAAFHCDAAQWLGKLPASGLGACDFLTGSAHKFGGPRGTGFLKVTGPFRSLRGGPQEEGRRAGTENLPGIAAMVAALEAAETGLKDRQNRESPRDVFEAALLRIIPGTTVVGRNSPRLWNTSLLVMPFAANVKWLARLSRLGFEISTGSACSRGGGASEVLAAMGLPEEAAQRVLRISATPAQSAADWESLAAAFGSVAGSLAPV